jgi:drug/metabolite transporter (DMT)-like permease
MNLPLKTLLLTGLAVIAFAANSVIARQALLGPEIGPWTYTSLRLLSGALVLAIMVGPAKSWKAGSWAGAIYLLIYAGLFSLAYISLPAGIGALILFTTVQITMVGYGLLRGERLSTVQAIGAVFAFLGLIYLLNPGRDAPPLWGAVLMIGSGIGWGLYSLKGRSSQNPTRETSGNFIKASILAIGIAIPYFLLTPEPSPQFTGIVLAVVSGAITSGLGYAIWYTALPHLSAVRAGLAQLTVPAIAAAGGVVLLAEPATARFIIASLVILTGVGIATLSGPKR